MTAPISTAYMWQHAPGDNDHVSPDLPIGWFVDSDDEYRAWIKFPLASGSVGSATLNLMVTGGSIWGYVPIRIYRIRRNDISEDYFSWNNYKYSFPDYIQWSTAGCSNTTTDYDNTVYADIALPSGDGPVSVDVTSLYNACVAAGDSSFNLLLVPNKAFSNYQKTVIGSLTNSTQGNRPSIEYTSGTKYLLFKKD